MAVGQVFYTPWCDEHGKVIDDGTVSRLAEHAYRWTAAEPNLRWITENAVGLEVHDRRHLRAASPRSRCKARRPRALLRGSPTPTSTG